MNIYSFTKMGRQFLVVARRRPTSYWATRTNHICPSCSTTFKGPSTVALIRSERKIEVSSDQNQITRRRRPGDVPCADVESRVRQRRRRGGRRLARRRALRTPSGSPRMMSGQSPWSGTNSFSSSPDPNTVQWILGCSISAHYCLLC